MDRSGRGVYILRRNRSLARCVSAWCRLRALRWGTVFLLGAAAIAHADEQPSAAMMEPVRQLADFMSALPRGKHASMFAREGICIVENFAPFLFCGPGAALAWEAGFRAHSAEGQLSELAARFDKAHDFTQSGNRVYFSLPTTWSGRTHGRTFEEHGAWAFVLERDREAWHIVGYGWGVFSYQEAEN